MTIYGFQIPDTSIWGLIGVLVGAWIAFIHARHVRRREALSTLRIRLDQLGYEIRINPKAKTVPMIWEDHLPLVYEALQTWIPYSWPWQRRKFRKLWQNFGGLTNTGKGDAYSHSAPQQELYAYEKIKSIQDQLPRLIT